MNDDILLKYHYGTLDEKARADVLSWLESDPDHLAHFASMHLSDTINEMHQPVLSEKEAAARLAAAGWPLDRAKRHSFPRWITIVVRVAAVLLIPLAILSLRVIARKNAEIARLTADATVERVAPVQQDASWLYTVNPGVKGDVLLPDGSRVRLNSASSLRCPERFAAESRVVELSGEGFFEVVGNPDWPLFVKTTKGVTVKVTGTKFNVSAYEDDEALKLTLVEGNVTLIHDASDRHFDVRPNEEMVFYTGRKVQPLKKAVDVQPAIVWKDGILLFENARMDGVVKKLERWYGVSITVQDPAILSMQFTASFESESLSQVLQLLKITSKIDYRIDGHNVSLFRN